MESMENEPGADAIRPPRAKELQRDPQPANAARRAAVDSANEPPILKPKVSFTTSANAAS
jgi:hypothetical protein